MLHMLIATHGADTCPASRMDIRQRYLGELRRMDEAAGALGASITGSWSNMAGHVIYVVVDAPNAHVVHQLASDLRLMDWSTVDVNPVVPLDEAAARIEKREALA